MSNVVPVLLAAGFIMIITAMAWQVFSGYVTLPDFSGQEKPFEARVSAMSLPRPGVPVKMGIFARALWRCEDARIRAEISEGFEFLFGETEWHGEMHPNDVRSVVFLVKPRGLGQFTVKGYAECRNPDSLLSDTVEYEYNITSESTTVEWRRA